MDTTTGGLLERETLARAGPLIGLCTVALTAAFVGVIGLASGATGGVVGRLPLYVLASAVAFVATLLAAEDRRGGGVTTLIRAGVVGAVGFVLLGLGTEGVIYAVTNPDAVVASHLFVYLLSAAIIASGLGYWAVQNRGLVRALIRGSRI
ncbi:hypothetical protein [Halosegnis sp.]|uniref:hypothetical protein n=1 Tax=Halosegnis sp. TaxID=2864959 RepID=UPI0035D416D2